MVFDAFNHFGDCRNLALDTVKIIKKLIHIPSAYTKEQGEQGLDKFHDREKLSCDFAAYNI